MSNKRYYWLKFKDDFFASKRIKKLRKLGADYLIIYLKMQLKALKTEGVLNITGIEDNVADEIALDIDEDSDKVQLTLSYLQACGLIETTTDEIFLPYVAENTGSENASTQRVREFRKRQKALHCNGSVTEVKRLCNVEKEIEKEKDIDINNKSNKELDELRLRFEQLAKNYRSVHDNPNGKSKARDKYIKWCTTGCKVDGKNVKFTPEQIENAFGRYVQEHINKEERGEWIEPYKNINTIMNNIMDWMEE